MSKSKEIYREVGYFKESNKKSEMKLTKVKWEMLN